MIHTTLNRIRTHSPCRAGWATLLDYLGKTQADDEPLGLATVLASNGLADALWCLEVEPQHEKLWGLFAVRCVRRAQHLLHDERSIAALDVAERYANGLATGDALAAAYASARDAAVALRDSYGYGYGRVGAAFAAADTALDHAWDAAQGAAAGVASWDATGKAGADIAQDLKSVFESHEAAPGAIGLPLE